MTASDAHLLPDGIFWIGFDDRGMSKSASIERNGKSFCEEGGLAACLCRAPTGGSLFNRPKSDFTLEEAKP